MTLFRTCFVSIPGGPRDDRFLLEENLPEVGKTWNLTEAKSIRMFRANSRWDIPSDRATVMARSSAVLTRLRFNSRARVA